MKKLFYLLGIPVFILIVYVIGPRPLKANLESTIPEISYNGTQLEMWIDEKESSVEGLKQDNEARIIWFDDSLKTKTEYVLIYLHGFSASQGEGEPIHRDFALRYGMNLFLPRLYEHGVSHDNIFLGLTVDNYMNSAKEAIAVGKQLGKKVILMSTSTGGTMSLYLAQHNPDIAALIMYSPNIKINNDAASLTSGPWGLQITRLVTGDNSFDFRAESKEDSLYWTKKYRIEGLVTLQQLLDLTMTETVFNNVIQPVFMGYYYKNELEQDPVVVVESMLEMYDKLGTPQSSKRKIAFDKVGKHVIASKYKSKDWESVRDETFRFGEEILGLRPVLPQKF